MTTCLFLSMHCNICRLLSGEELERERGRKDNDFLLFTSVVIVHFLSVDQKKSNLLYKLMIGFMYSSKFVYEYIVPSDFI